jgi:hypothetical protein
MRYLIAALMFVLIVLLFLSSYSAERFKDRGYWPIFHHYGPKDPVLKVFYKRNGEVQSTNGDIYETVIYGNGSILRKVNEVSFFDPRPDTGRLFAATRIINFPFQKIYTCNMNLSDYIVEFNGEDGPMRVGIGCGPMMLYNDLTMVS